MPPHSATLLINAAARGVPERLDGRRIARFLEERDVATRLVVPDSPEDALREAHRSAEAGDRWLFVVGGDGSLRVVAPGIAGTETALAALPLGTVNVWAREAGIPTRLRAALECHLGGRIERIDLGRGDGHCFLLMASIGWDASVVRDVSDSLKRRIGDLAYIVEGARKLPRLHTRPVQWSVDGELNEEPVALMVLGNTRLYGGRVKFTPNAVADDGLLDYVALAPHNAIDAATHGIRLVTGHLPGASHVIEGRTHELAIKTPGLAVQFDGDYIGETPITLSVEAGALAVSLPAGPLPAFFG